MQRLNALLTTLLLTAVSVCAGAAESYPVRPIRIVVPTGAGGITDLLARIVAQKLGDNLGQQVLVDNRPGASGIVGSDIVAKATPDGYTLLMVFPSHPVNLNLYSKLPYDTVKAFAPVTMVGQVVLVMLVNPSTPAHSARELIDLTKARPGQINFGSVGKGSLGHLAAELLRSLSGANITHVAYKGVPQVMGALIAGEVSLFFDPPITAMPQVKAGRVRALGVTTKRRLAVLPDIPAIAETVPGYEVIGWNGILAPAGTPVSLITRLNAELVKVLRSPEIVEKLSQQGVDPVGNTPVEFAHTIRSDIDKWAKVIKDAGIRAE